MARTQTVSIALTPREKERWKAAQECTPFENLAAFVRYSMESVTDMVLSVGSTEELEVMITTQPRSDGQKTVSVGKDLGVQLDYADKSIKKDPNLVG